MIFKEKRGMQDKFKIDDDVRVVLGYLGIEPPAEWLADEETEETLEEIEAEESEKGKKP